MAGWTKTTLLILLFAAASVRLIRVHHLTPVVEGDGCEYSRLAENLVAGRGYVGMLAGAEIMLPPLYPVTIALVMKVTGWEAPLSGRLVSMVASLAFALLMARLVQRHGGDRAAKLALVLAAFSPGMVLLGSAVFAEALQLALLAGGAVCLAEAFRSHQPWRALIAGLWFGAAYLARVESAVVAFLGAGILCGSGWIGSRRPPKRQAAVLALSLLLGFAVAGAPYVAYLKQTTGEWRLEGKSERVTATIDRYAQGQKYREANYGVGDDGEELGPWLVPNEVLRGGPSLISIAIDQPWPFFRHVASNFALLVWKLSTGEAFSSILLLILAGAAFLKIAPRRELPLDLWFLGALLASMGLGSLYKFVLRYAVGVALPLYALAALGGAALWTHWERRRGRRISPGVGFLSVAVLVLSLCRGFITGNAEFHESLPAKLPLKALGHELRNPSIPTGTIMSDDPRPAYYAGRRWTPLPVAKTARGFWLEVLRRSSTVVIIDRTRADGIPGAWWREDDPPRPTTLIAESGAFRAYTIDLFLAEQEATPR
jgi:hypothetical protein